MKKPLIVADPDVIREVNRSMKSLAAAKATLAAAGWHLRQLPRSNDAQNCHIYLVELQHIINTRLRSRTQIEQGDN